MFAELRRASTVADPEMRRRLIELAERLLKAMPDPIDATTENAAAELTTREIDVLAHAAIGRKNAEIATILDISAETVKSYLRSTMNKLGVHSRLDAVERARTLGVIL